jgi:hypothetical protein
VEIPITSFNSWIGALVYWFVKNKQKIEEVYETPLLKKQPVC